MSLYFVFILIKLMDKTTYFAHLGYNTNTNINLKNQIL